MLGHLELRIAVFEMINDIEKEPGAPKFGITIEAKNENLLLVGRHAAEIHQFSCSPALRLPPEDKNIGFVRAANVWNWCAERMLEQYLNQCDWSTNRQQFSNRFDPLALSIAYCKSTCETRLGRDTRGMRPARRITTRMPASIDALWLALRRVPGVGPRTARLLLEKFGAPEQIFAATAAEIAA
ncbi:MAG TPA: hypothetical protein VNF29_01105, partial [Candidatus Binataceae bacterium]|nr:hypothetical protein [Candidatus Binataceae bacterium]